ncbi:MAG TPA: acetate--CoA ligase family protein [Candidatus Omnitrophota bacterium]|nr:acetate--CoA ligase family protein [Candidatus Omnitrophota bacterium]HQO58518.1 acetate--CoA ligase family protein [Candidatus Omnitrophota bacterium]
MSAEHNLFLNSQGDQVGKQNLKDLKGVFYPQRVAIIGASANPAKIGFQILQNVIEAGFPGDILPVNPKEDVILGQKTYSSVQDIPGAIDLAVIAIPAKMVLATMQECARKGIKNISIITSGFSEVGNKAEEEQIKRIADENGIAVLGPNTLGIVYTPSRLNASFGPKSVLPGKIAFISQSGALAIALMGWTVMEKIGLAALINLGNKADVEEQNLIEYFNNDDNVNVVVIYMEGLKDGQSFLKTVIKKPVVVLKVGRSSRGAKAAASHTGSLAGSDGIYDAAFRQMGLLRANTFTEAFNWSRTLSLPMPKGRDAVIITNGGGIGVFATDECEAAGIALLDDPVWLEEKFRSTMPDFGSTKNPIDITGQGHGDQYSRAARVAFVEDRIHTAIVLYCETAVTDPLAIAKALADEYDASGRQKPFIVTMVGGARSREALLYLNERHIPAFGAVDEAVSALKALYSWKEISSRPKDNPVAAALPVEALSVIEKVKAEGRTALMEHEARQVMQACGVPTPRSAFVNSLDQALKEAEGMYPLAMKIASPDIIHKTDVGGVVLNIKSPEELQEKYERMMDNIARLQPQAKLLGVNLVQMVQGIECIVGMSRDAQFGPVVMFGLGGVFVEALKDVSFRVVPFGQVEAGRLIQEIKSRKILDGFRGMKAHKESIIQTICAVQKLSSVVKEVDINPLVSNQDGSFAVDARIIL